MCCPLILSCGHMVRPREYICAYRDESLVACVQRECVPDEEWVRRNKKKQVRIGDRVFLPRTPEMQAQMQEHMNGVITQANQSPFATPIRAFVGAETSLPGLHERDVRSRRRRGVWCFGG